MYYMTVIESDGSFSPVQEQENAPGYKQIKAALSGGLLEHVPYFDKYGTRPCVAFCDEEGKLKGLDMNPKATYLWYACLAPEPFRPDTLHGAIVIIAADTEAELKEL